MYTVQQYIIETVRTDLRSSLQWAPLFPQCRRGIFVLPVLVLPTENGLIAISVAAGPQ